MSSKAFTFVIGGAKSGKTAFALRKADGYKGAKLFVATAEALDAEMSERISSHKAERGPLWDTMEEPREVAAKIEGLTGNSAVLIDCLTLWVTNLIASGEKDADIMVKARSLMETCAKYNGPVIAVSNEVGYGIVPENALARRFRDLAGKVNQLAAEAADEVFLVAAGIPLRLK